MDPKFLDRLVRNVMVSPRLMSVWWNLILGILGTVWFTIDPGTRDTFLSHLPFPGVTLPILGAVIAWFLRVMPQNLDVNGQPLPATPAPQPVAPQPEKPAATALSVEAAARGQ